MGVPDLWSVTGNGKVVSLAELSAQFFEKHNRPIRIAADFPQWIQMMGVDGLAHRIRNLTEQGKKAREPEMMALAYRLLEIQRLNIQLLIVFDGPARFDRKSGSSHSTTAASSASPGPSAEVEEVFDATGQSDAPDLIKELFRELGIPHTRAPGDCEAECCRMAELGIVDAVWSADSDCLMFGARTVLSRRTIAGSEPWHTCSVLEMDDVQLATGLTKRGAIIFAILKGCDYGRGLAGVSTDLALSIATKFPNLRESLPFLSRGSVSRWRSALWEAILSLKPDWETRPERDVFPTISFVHFCCQPIRSSDKALLSLPCIRTRWVELYGPSLRSTYDFIRELFRPLWRGTTPPRFALRILAAVELNNLLAFDAGSQDEKANSYSIIVKRRPKKTVQTSIIVRADAVFPNLAKECPNDFSKKPEQQLTIRLLDCILRKVLPAEALREKHPPREEDTSDEEIIPESIRRPPRGRKRKRTQIEGSSRVAQARDDSANRRYQNPSVSPQRPARKRFRGRLTGDDDRTEDDHVVPYNHADGSGDENDPRPKGKESEEGDASDTNKSDSHSSAAVESEGTESDQADISQPTMANHKSKSRVKNAKVPRRRFGSAKRTQGPEVIDLTGDSD